MLKVTTVITGLGVGGAETQLLRTVECSRGRVEHQIIGLSSLDTLADRLRELGAEVLIGAAKRPRAALNRVKKFEPDAIIGRMYHGSIAASAMQSACPKSRLFWGVHHSLDDKSSDSISTRLSLALTRKISNRPSKILYVSERVAQQHEAVGYPADKRAVVYNGIDTERFAPDIDARNRIRSELGADESAVIIGIVARNHPVKNYPGGIAAFAQAFASFPRFRLLLCGKGTEDCDTSALPPHAVWKLGHRDDIPAIMNACDVGFVPSKAEAFGNTMLEFQACGKPVVATEVGDAEKALAIGLIVPAWNISALAYLLPQAASMSKQTRFSDAVRKHVIDRFTINRNVDNLIAEIS